MGPNCMSINNKILITGGNGYIGNNIYNALKKLNYTVLCPSKQQLNMIDINNVTDYFNTHNPNIIIHSASCGGHRNFNDDYTTYINNILMFENLMKVTTDNNHIIFYTSAADFDRRNNIHRIVEEDVIKYYPLDPYGLSKNIIVRRILQQYQNKKIHILRLFAIFNEFEIDSRFIKASIHNIKNKIPIQIHQNKEMDFVYIDDLISITLYIIQNIKLINNLHLNICYNKKTTLTDIADIIRNYTYKLEPKTIILNNTIANSYSGNSDKLKTLNIPFIGLEEGIRRTINKLL